MLRDGFHTKVSIKEELKKGLVFKLSSRLPIGMILGYFGNRHEVIPLMQVLNHGTRAYIWNENGL